MYCKAFSMFFKAIVISLWNDIQSQRDRWILWTPVPVAFGIGLYFLLKFEPPLYAGFAALAGLLLCLLPVYKNRAALYVWLAVFLFAIGFAAAEFRTWRIETPVLEKKLYSVLLQGRVAQVDALPKTHRIILEDITLKDGRGPREGRMPERVRIRLKGKDPVTPAAGDIIEIRAALLPLSPPVLPGAFDFQRHAFFKGLGATGYAISDVTIIKVYEDGYFFEGLRHYIQGKISAAIENKDTAGITTALLIGDGNGIAEKTWDIIRLSGIAHLLSISGFHITLVTGFLFFLVRALLALSPYIALHWPIKKVSAFISVFGAIFYTALIGSPVPAQRAMIMTCVVMGAIMLDRDPFTLRLAAFAAFVILLFAPESLAGPSFQLSFAAVIALIAFYESTRGIFERHRQDGWFKKSGIYLAGCMITTGIATLATAPFSLFHFSKVPVFSGFVTNMIAIPLCTFVTMPFGILAVFLMPLGLEKWPLLVAGKSVDLILQTATVTAAWPWSVMTMDAWPVGLLAVMALGSAWIAIWRGRLRWLGIVPVIVAALVIPLTPRPDILVSDEGSLFAVRDEAGVLWVSSKRAEKFVRQEWVEREGGEGVDFWPHGGKAGDVLACDAEACLYKKNGFIVSFIKNPAALQNDCTLANVVIGGRVAISGSQCAEPMVVLDKWDFRDSGAHAIYLPETGGMIEVSDVAEERGIRPWTGAAPRKF